MKKRKHLNENYNCASAERLQHTPHGCSLVRTACRSSWFRPGGLACGVDEWWAAVNFHFPFFPSQERSFAHSVVFKYCICNLTHSEDSGLQAIGAVLPEHHCCPAQELPGPGRDVLKRSVLQRDGYNCHSIASQSDIETHLPGLHPAVSTVVPVPSSWHDCNAMLDYKLMVSLTQALRLQAFV